MQSSIASPSAPRGDCSFQPHENRAGHDGVPDVQLGHVGEACDGLHVLEVKPVPGIDLDSQFVTDMAGAAQPFQLGFLLLAFAVGIGPGVEFDDRRAGVTCGLELHAVRVDEQ